jgi:hypothetical protein
MSHAEQLHGLLRTLDARGRTVTDLVRRGQAAEPWRLYPGEEGVFDRRTGYQFYYHTHDDGRDEDGHFHTVRFCPDRTVHLVAISMARDGWPQALFTVNLWAIGDAYLPAETLKALARRFLVDERRGPAALVRFVNLVFRTFRAEIARLQDEKSAALEAAAQRRHDPGYSPFEDRSLEILSRVPIDVRARAAGTPRGAPVR